MTPIATHRTWYRSVGLFMSIVIVVVLAMLATGCTASQEPQVTPQRSATTPIPQQYSSWYRQVLQWRTCASTFQCATAKVPLDWAAAQGAGSASGDAKSVDIALIRHRATGKKLGTLFTNPGGPGVAGVAFVRDNLKWIVDPNLLKHYDIVGFDPRGVGESTAVTCFTTAAQMDDFLFGLPTHTPGTAAYVDEVRRSTAKFGKACQRHTGALLAHVDSESVVKDLDVLRALVHDNRFNYLGFSYGTMLGLLYAQRFPTHVGRVVLDGVLDPALSGDDIMLGQVGGFDGTLNAFLKYCLNEATCPFSGTVTQAQHQLRALLRQVQDHPLTASDGRKLGVSTLITSIMSAMYSQMSWPDLKTALQGVVGHRPDAAFDLADAYYDRQDGRYTDNSTEAFYAINCLDYPDEHTAATFAAYEAKLRGASKVFGSFYADGTQQCAGWPVKPTGQPVKVTAPGAPGMLLLGTTGDPATPYAWAKAAAKRLPKSRLLTVKGEQHTAYSAQASSCTRGIVDTYLLAGKLPARGAKCNL